MKLLLVDGHYYAYRSFYAIRHLKNSKGEPTNMLYGFTKAIQRMITDLSPDRAAVVMDGGLPKERMEAQQDYKANRAETPDEMKTQLPHLESLVPALGLPYIMIAGEEADDVIATYAKQASLEGHQVAIATNDKDIMQMVNPTISIYQPDGDGFTLLDEKAVEEKWNVPPSKIGDVLMLTGDSVDNIPGVPGIGPKTASSLIREFGSVDNLLANLSSVKNEKQRQKIEDHRELINNNRIMVSLKTEMTLPRAWKSLELSPNYSTQVELFQGFEFKTFLREAEQKLTSSKPKSAQGELF